LPYGASNAAVIALTTSVAEDAAQAAIRVNSTSAAFIGPGEMWDRPGRVADRDPRSVLPRPARAGGRSEDRLGPAAPCGPLDEVAATVRFLLSGEATHITAFDIQVAAGAA
jgi:NAD(P)-dependent dehydrogenase (short-subunit alcohol dehydrogenase family)